MYFVLISKIFTILFFDNMENHQININIFHSFFMRENIILENRELIGVFSDLLLMGKYL